jgi:hypothetical protein
MGASGAIDRRLTAVAGMSRAVATRRTGAWARSRRDAWLLEKADSGDSRRRGAKVVRHPAETTPRATVFGGSSGQIQGTRIVHTSFG